MTAQRPEWILTDEEPKLARYLVDCVVGKAAGTFEAECTHNAPRDKYFIGSLRPTPPDDDADGGSRGGFLDELLSKLAPVAFGAEFALRPAGPECRVIVQLEWSCYYRVFPGLDEQRIHQRHDTGHSVESEAAEAASESSVVPAQDEDGGDESESPATGDGGSGRNRRGRQPPTDVFFPKYRKIRCAAEGAVRINKAPSGDEWLADCSDLESSITRELVRCSAVVLGDADHLRTGPDPEAKLRVPAAALASAAAYTLFLNQLTNAIVPEWHWSIAARFRPGDDPGELVLVMEVTNRSTVDTRSWHSDGFFFDVKAKLAFHEAEVVPFELELAPRGFRYDRYIWGRGFNCEVVRCDQGPYAFETTNAPVYTQQRYSTNTEPPATFHDLSADPVSVLRRILGAMRGYEHEWARQRTMYAASDPTWASRHGEEYERDHNAFGAEIERFETGVQLIEHNPDIQLAFRLTNQAFALSGEKSSWRLFQIVFIVAQLPSIEALRTGGEGGLAERSVVDIIYFPTGGGKTEAYLGIIVFHCFYDRLRGKTAGVTAWTRFPLRLLTLQQMQRVADVIGAADVIRSAQPERRLSGTNVDGFAVGYFVGQEATPNELTPPRHGEPPDANWSTAIDPEARQRWKKIIRCPVCRTTTVSVEFDSTAARLWHKCSNRTCRFPGGQIPVYIVDNEIYRYLPSVVVGTIDKLAGLGNQRKMSLVLGQVTGRCSIHGYYSAKCCQKDCADPRRLRPGRPAGVSGPTLFVQDELHLLKEGLGTFDGHYETFLQALQRHFGDTLPAKIIASSATIEAFDRQVQHLYGRRARVFPGLGPTLASSFYARTLDHPQRLFVGVLPHNKTIFNAALELFQYYHETIADLLNLPGEGVNPYGGRAQPGSSEWRMMLDPYLTSIGYFSSTRELNQLRTDLETHVNTELERSGRPALRIAELSGSTTTENVTRILESLEGASANSAAPTTILATSMISHGVDVDRFNLMMFYGMPKQNAEYIQSSSRVGRAHVGVVFACMKPARERDQSHFAYFSKYHEFLGQLIEPVAINRWSKFSIQRTLPGLFMAVLLQQIANGSGELNPNKFYMVDFVKRLISEGRLRADDFIDLLAEAYLVQDQTEAGAAAFRDELERRVRQYLDQILGAGGHATFVSDALVPPPMRSLRDVDEQIEIEMDSNGTTWASRADH